MDIGQISSRTEAADTQSAEHTSKEHSKTELQRLNQKRSQIEVHEITVDCDNSWKMSASAHATEASQTSATMGENKERDNAGKEGKLAEVSHRRPRVMRFCPSLSTSEIDISLSGKTHFSF
jgi:hypothetical protein